MANSTTTGITTTAVTSEDMRSRPLYLSMPRVPPKIYLKTVNPEITCKLCKGYLIDATTIVECLHSFCHSCIMMYLRQNLDAEIYCPAKNCRMSINKVKPNIKPDATLQAIVYKLVPGLYEKELLRRRAFYKIRTKEALQATPEQRGDDTEHLIFGPNESISLVLEYSDTDHSYRSSDDENSNSSHDVNDHCDDDFEMQLRRPKYLQCPAIFTISNLKKFLLHKFSINPNKFCVEIMYKVKTSNIYISLPDYYTLMDVAYIYTWKRDAPMKFFYCVRAAHSPVEQNAVIYDLPSNRFQTNSRLTFDSTDQDQSSDADSDVRSEGTKRNKKELNTNGALPAKERPNEQVNSTSNEDAIASSSTTLIKCEPPKTPTHSVNGNENRKNDILDKIKKEPNTSPTTSSRLTAPAPSSSPTIKMETNRSSSDKPQQQQQQPQIDRRANGTSPKPNAFKSRISTDGKTSSSPSRTNSDNKDVKEKVKTKSPADNVSTKSSSEPKTLPTTSDRVTSKSSTDSKPPIERSKSRLLFNKEENSRSLSPPLSAENEYDFDQHLLKEKLSEKKKFLSSIHLTPRIPGTETSSTVVSLSKNTQNPKSELIMNLSKDNSKSAAANESNSASSTTTTTTTTTKLPSSSASSSLSPSTTLSGGAGLNKKSENKASKRKSREPVKNVAKVKCSSPNEQRSVESKSWDTKSSTIQPTSTTAVAAITTGNITTTSTITTTTATTTTTTTNERLKDTHSPSTNLTAQNVKQSPNTTSSTNATRKDMNNQSKSSTHSTNLGKSNLVKTNFSSPSTSKTKSPITFKTPPPSTISNLASKDGTIATSSSSSSSSASSETSIIINNVQRPNQADTPRPLMQAFKPPKTVQPLYFPILNRGFSTETEIQEIRGDDAGKVKVYGPPMSTNKAPFETQIPNLVTSTNEFRFSPYGPYSPYQFAIGAALQQQINLEFMKAKGLLSGGNSPKLNVTTANSLHAALKMPELTDPTKHPNVQNLLTNCKIPSSLSITVTNDETESMTRSLFNNKNTNVVNSIEIVKLTDESTPNDSTTANSQRFSSTSIGTSSPSNLIQTIEKESTRTNSPVAINLSNNHKTTTTTAQSVAAAAAAAAAAAVAAAATNLQQNNTFKTSYQAEFMQSIMEGNKVAKKSKPIKINRPIQPQTTPPALKSIDELTKEAQKRKSQSFDDNKLATNANKIRRINHERPILPSTKSIPITQRPVPDLVMAKDEKRIISSDSNVNSISSSSSGSSSCSSSTSSSTTSTSTTSTTSLNKSTIQTSQTNTTSTTNAATAAAAAASVASTNTTATTTTTATIKKPTPERKSSPSSNATAVPTAGVNALDKAIGALVREQTTKVNNDSGSSKYLPLQTSSMPFWKNHSTPDQIASHKALVENLTQSKKNSGTIVD